MPNQMPDTYPVTLPLWYDTQTNISQLTRVDKNQPQAVALFSVIQSINNQIMSYCKYCAIVDQDHDHRGV